MSAETVAPPTESRSLPLPYPKTERQAELMALAERLGAFAGERAAQHDRDGAFPHESIDALRKAGYPALTVPREFGGQGADPLELALAQERLAYGDGSVGLGSWMHLGLIARQATSRTWPAAIFERICREIVEEGALVNAAASEPDLGSPSRGGLPSTTAVRTPEGWRINGRKSWVSLAPALKYCVVMATVQDDGQPPRRAHFLVPMSTPGVRVNE